MKSAEDCRSSRGYMHAPGLHARERPRDSQWEKNGGILKISWMYETEGKVVGPARFERATLCLEGRCSIHLSYGPILFILSAAEIYLWPNSSAR
jgi:hypothetical protein